MKVIAISDTHGQHRWLSLPPGDLIIHAGDLTKTGKREQVADFLDWFTSLDYAFKIFIAGNHDFFFEEESAEMINQMIPKGVTYLNDAGCDVNGIKIWGSPVQPWFHNLAFNRTRGKEISRHWDLIPEDTDILITHGPAYGILDSTYYNESVGCKDLLQKIQDIQPKIHISGHIHEAYGVMEKHGVTFVNASIVNRRYLLSNHPVELTF